MNFPAVNVDIAEEKGITQRSSAQLPDVAGLAETNGLAKSIK
jgi:hypothetical protein